VQFPLTGAVILGSVPAVLVGSWLSSRTSDRWLRPAIFCVVLASGLKYAGSGNVVLAVVVGVAVAAVALDAVRTAHATGSSRSARLSQPAEPQPAVRSETGGGAELAGRFFR
jgi:hypothetical protein